MASWENSSSKFIYQYPAGTDAAGGASVNKSLDLFAGVANGWKNKICLLGVMTWAAPELAGRILCFVQVKAEHPG